MFMTKFHLEFNIEVAEAKGEDANLAEDFEQTFLMGVFDGLGGASAGYDGQTGGRIASAEASQITKEFFQQRYGKITPENAIELQNKICQSLKFKADNNMPKSRLKGTLLQHRLCTTIALASILKQPKGQERIFEANLAWMGDSRIYFFSPTQGLQQLTKDDLKTPKDALEMLRQDPPMSQCLTADITQESQIHFQHYEIEGPGCFLACTDGCFQYFSAPWEFEKLLLDTLFHSDGDKIDTNNWQELIYERYTEIKQDDVSLILYPVGFHTVKSLRSAYKQRWEYFQETFFSPTANTRYDELQSLWEKYRIDYEDYFQFIQDPEPPANSQLPLSAEKSSLAISTTSNLSKIDQFKEISELSRQKAASKAEEIQSLLDRANSCFYENNQLTEAEDLCNQILNIDAHHCECKYILGLIYTKLALVQTNDCQKEVYFNEAILKLEDVRKSLGEKNIESLQALGYIYCSLYRWDRAFDCYQKSFQCPGSEKIDDWEEHLEMFVTSLLRSKVNKQDAPNLAIQFCQHLANSLPYGKNAYPYYFMAVLQEIKGELHPALISIKEAMKIYNSSYSSGVKYEKVQKSLEKHQEIHNKYYYHRS